MIGLGVFDCLARDIVDPDTGDIYPALSCKNDQVMALRCTSINAEKAIWSIKANANFNSECAILLREGFRSGKIRLLESEYDGDVSLTDIKGYSSMNPQEKIRMQLPYIHTTMLIDELVKLQHEEAGGKIKIRERSGMRKDRYSSLSYNYYVAIQLENKLGRRQITDTDTNDIFVIRAPKTKGSRKKSNVRW